MAQLLIKLVPIIFLFSDDFIVRIKNVMSSATRSWIENE